jgi:hypothetical protein
VDGVCLGRGHVPWAHGLHVELEGVVAVCVERVLVVERRRGHGDLEGSKSPLEF